MDIVFSSDLHTDITVGGPQLKIEWLKGDVLVIAGDIANTIGDALKTLRRVARIYPHVIYVLGNHEHYSNAPQKRTVEDTEDRIASQLPANVHLLTMRNPHVEIDGVHFVGCTGWYTCDVDDPGCAIDEGAMIQKMKDSDFNDRKWIGWGGRNGNPWDRGRAEAEIVRSTISAITDDRPIVVVTHVPPHRDLARWRGVHDWDKDNLFYINTAMTDVLCEFNDRVAIWCCGHVHARQMKNIGSTLMIVNPRGYRGQNPGWEPILIDMSEFT